MHVHHLSLSVICVFLAIGCEESRVNELGLAEVPQRDAGVNLGGQEIIDSEPAREASGEEAIGGGVSSGEVSGEETIGGDVNAVSERRRRIIERRGRGGHRGRARRCGGVIG